MTARDIAAAGFQVGALLLIECYAPEPEPEPEPELCESLLGGLLEALFK
jgi:hypothetical protein